MFCKAYHPSSDCNKVTDPKKHFDLVKAAELCFNCLGHHKVSACTSKGRCKNCRCKHHTGLCQNPSNTNLPKQQSDIPQHLLHQLHPSQSTKVLPLIVLVIFQLLHHNNKTNDLILNLTPENMTQNSRIE